MLESILGEIWLVLFLGVVFGIFIWLTLYLIDVSYPSGEPYSKRWLAVVTPITYAVGVLFILEVVRIYSDAVC